MAFITVGFSRHPESLTRKAANNFRRFFEFVMPGLVPGIHVLAAFEARKTWMAGTSPAMTKKMKFTRFDCSSNHRCEN